VQEANNYSVIKLISFLNNFDPTPDFVCFAACPGGQIQDDKGYNYTFNYTMKNGDKTWRCSRRTMLNCKAYVRSKGQFIVGAFNDHNHEPGSSNPDNLDYGNTLQSYPAFS
jgi:hypothetical protein